MSSASARSKPAALAPAAPAPVLLERHKAALRSYVRALSAGDEKSVEAAVNAVWQEAQSARNAEFEEDPTVWLFSNARRRVVGSAGRNPLANEAAPAAADEETAGEKEEPRVAVHRTIGLLTAKQQEVLRLKFQFNFNLEEMGTITGQARAAIGGLLHHAITRIGRALGSRDDDDSPLAGDPRMTAYALDEMDADERKFFERSMPNGKALVERGRAIQEWGGHVAQVLSSGAPLPRRRRKPKGRTGRRAKWPLIALGVLVAAGVYAVKHSRGTAGDAPSSTAGVRGAPAGHSKETLLGGGERMAGQPSGHPGTVVMEGGLTRIRGKSDAKAESRTSSRTAASGERPDEPGPARSGANPAGRGEGSGRDRLGRDRTGSPGSSSSGKGNEDGSPTASPGVREARAPDVPSDARPEERAGARAGAAATEPARRSRHASVPRPGGSPTASEEMERTGDRPGEGRPPETVDVLPMTGGLQRQLALKQWPARGQVRMAEMITHVPVGEKAPLTGNPVEARVEQAPSPWSPGKSIVRVSLQARESSAPARGPANLVFAIDVSKSMAGPNRLPLVQEGVRRLVDRLRPGDSIAVVTYAGEARLALPAMPALESGPLRRCLSGMEAEGMTNGFEGLRLAYETVRKNWKEGGLNVVVLCTDGNFNLGHTDDAALAALVAAGASQGIRLSVFGFGRNDRNDLRLELLAANGGGRSCYVNTAVEAERQLVGQIDGLFAPVAQDVRLQVRFNPDLVQDYRRVGDGPPGDTEGVAAALLPGRNLTALFEITPGKLADANRALGELQFSFALPGSSDLWEQKTPLPGAGQEWVPPGLEFRFALAMAEFGRILQDGQPAGRTELDRLDEWVRANLTEDTGGYRAELLHSLELAKGMAPGRPNEVPLTTTTGRKQ